MPDTPLAAPAPAPEEVASGTATVAAVDHGHGAHRFSFIDALAHHSLPYPAWEVVHGKPLLVFDLGAYAAKKYSDLSVDPRFAEAKPDGATLAWAARVGEKKGITDTSGLAKAMVVAEQKSLFGAMPQSLSWLNQYTFFGSFALLFTALIVCVLGRRRADQVKPPGRLQHAIEGLVLFIRDQVVRPNIHHGDSWTPHFAALFFAILGFNLFGLIPGGGAASANIHINGAFAAMTLAAMLVFGMREQGVVAFWVNLVPVHFSFKPLDLATWLILAVIEVMGLVIKPAALAIRLFANMFAGHTVILAFTTLLLILASANAPEVLSLSMGAFGMLVAIAIFLLKLLVAFIQAYVFTLLSAVFIGAAMHPEH